MSPYDHNLTEIFKNLSAGQIQDQDTEESSLAWKVINSLCLVLISIVATFTNSLSLAAMFKSRWILEKSIVILASLAVADLLTGVFVPLKIYVWYFSESELGSAVSETLVDIGVYASLSLLIFVAIDRFVAITFTMNYDRWISLQTIKYVLIFIWVVSVVRAGKSFTEPTLYAKTNETKTGRYETGTDRTYYRNSTENWAANFGAYGLTIVLFLALYGRMWMIARDQLRKIHAETYNIDQSAGVGRMVTTGIGEGEVGKTAAKGEEGKEVQKGDTHTNSNMITNIKKAPASVGNKKTSSKANKTVALILLVYIASWLPAFCATPLALRGLLPTDVVDFTIILGLLNACVNFFVYAWTNSKFRRAYRSMLGFRQDPSEGNSWSSTKTA